MLRGILAAHNMHGSLGGWVRSPDVQRFADTRGYVHIDNGHRFARLGILQNGTQTEAEGTTGD